MSEYVLRPSDGRYVQLGGLGVRHMIESDRTGGAFALVEHPIAPRALAAPTHTHTHEDEYSYVLEGRVGVQIGDEVLVAGPGELVFKPRGIPHAFWNAGDEPARLLELIAPAAFAAYFDEIAPALPPTVREPDLQRIAEIQARYGLTMDMDSIGPLVERHGLVMEALPPSTSADYSRTV
ncbi:MAG TPA: cupin domain-containing protein [Thermoleophilaceae bacterium]